MKHDKHTYGTEWTTRRRGSSYLGLDDKIEYLHSPSWQIQRSARAVIRSDALFRLFMSARNLEHFIGDLEERYGLIAAEEGSQAATRWFWREVIHSFFSLAVDAIWRISGIEKLFRRIGP